MAQHTINKKCPKCKRNRKYYPHQDSRASIGWKLRDGVKICPWCIAREAPGGEAILRKANQNRLKAKKSKRKDR